MEDDCETDGFECDDVYASNTLHNVYGSQKYLGIVRVEVLVAVLASGGRRYLGM